jgi:enoyl-CoA hydratase/carnithine racemase
MAHSVLFENLATTNGKFVGQAILNVEGTLNSLTLEMVDLLLDQLAVWQSDESVVAIFIRGAGEKALCAGGDVQALHQSSVSQPGGPCEYAETFFEREYRLDYLLHTYCKPTIVWGHGIVMGGGLGILAACKHRIVTEKTRIAMPEVTIALFPDVGGSYFLNKMPGYCGRFLALTAASINAVDSVYAGLADYCLNHEQYDRLCETLLQLSWSGDRLEDDRLISRAIQELGDSAVEKMPAGNLENHQTQIDYLCEGDDVVVIADRIAALTTDDKWLSKAKVGLAGGSPLAIKWIFRQLNLAKGLPLKDIFQSELLLGTNIMRHPEFAEGVRALLIDKDQSPNWQIADLDSVSEDAVAAFFQAPWPQNPLADL